MSFPFNFIFISASRAKRLQERELGVNESVNSSLSSAAGYLWVNQAESVRYLAIISINLLFHSDDKWIDCSV